MKINKWIKAWTIGLLVAGSSLQAEVQQLTLTWTAQLCEGSCLQVLQNYLSKIPGVANLSINQGAGQAVLTYQPNAPYSFVPVNSAMSMIGLTIKDIRIAVKGTIIHDDRTVTLMSSGDNTPFTLVSPIVPNVQGYTPKYSMYSHSLSDSMRAQLIQAEQSGNLVTVSGPLLEPERSPPNVLIVERMTISKPTATANQR